MQLGFIGLGKMGGNMVHRIHRDSDHQVVAFDYREEAVRRAESDGATGVRSLEDLVETLAAPGTVWLMVPSGDPTEQTIEALGMQGSVVRAWLLELAGCAFAAE